ncbi:MAG: caspase family protein [Devosia sp.]
MTGFGRIGAGVLAWLCAALVLAAPVAGQDKALRGVALVIGESKYEAISPLANPNQDARDIDRLLGDLGFDVNRVLNADAGELREAIEEFIADAEDADVALVYYSGHGIEVGGENYLVPTDTDFASPEIAGAALVPVAPLLDALAKAVPVTIILLDACRSDPFPAGTVVQLPGEAAPMPVSEQGLAAVRGPTPVAQAETSPESLGAVIGFAAEPGQPALDGAPGENSPYAAALLKHLAAGGFSFGDIMTMVTEEVYLKTRAKQLPWTNSSLRRVLSFGEAAEETEGDDAAIKGERRKLLLSIATTPPVTRSYVEALAGEEAVPLDALYGMLNVLGVDVAEGDDLQQKLQTGAARLKELLAERSVAVKSDSELERFSKLAEAAESEGAIALALKYRDEASARADWLLADKQVEAERLKQDMVDIAQTYADNAATAVLNFDHARAAELYGKAYAAVADWDKPKALDFKVKQGDALTDRGYYTTENAALEAALAAYHEALAMAPRETQPLDWAKIEDRIGQTMQTLGERLQNATTLEGAVAHYEAALEVRTEADQPQDWAKTQNNLGNVLFSLGARNDDLDLLARSIPPFDAALKVLTPETEPIRWVTVANNRAASQVEIADVTYAATSDAEMAAMMAGVADPSDVPEVKAAREAANVALGAAIMSLEAAIGDASRTDNPLGWAMLKHTLATAYVQRGQMNHVPDDLRAGAEAYRDVLTVHTREQTPAQWVRTSNNRAIALKNLSDETNDIVPLDEAIGIYRAVIATMPRENLPLDWADYQENLGNALALVSTYDKARVGTLQEALDAYHLAGEITTLERSPARWQSLQISISTTLLMQGIMSFDKAKVEEAQSVALATRDKMVELGMPTDFFAAYLPQVEQVLGLFP